MKSVLSAKVADNEMIVLNEIKFDEPKTKEMIKMLANVKAGFNRYGRKRRKRYQVSC